MKLEITINIDNDGVYCCAAVNGQDAYGTVEANTIAVGALEIAKASLLARRWGLNIGNMDTSPPLVKVEKQVIKRGKK